jgi:hydrogenase nickel incorporation protein HypA/HybF
MHEMGITQGILAASFDAAQEAGATSISEIRISVGELTEIQEFALQFAFEAMTPGTMAEGATLVVEHIPATSRCRDCDVVYQHDRFQMLCPTCGTFNVEPLTGRELRIDSIEADTGDLIGGGEDGETTDADAPETPDAPDATSDAPSDPMFDPTDDPTDDPTPQE